MNLADQEAFEVSLIENIQRKTFDPLEEARAFQKYVLDNGWGSVSQLASRIGKSVSYVDKRMRLLTLPSNIVALISNSTLCPSTAEELLSVDDINQQLELAKVMWKKQLSSRQVRSLVRDRYSSSMSDIDK